MTLMRDAAYDDDSAISFSRSARLALIEFRPRRDFLGHRRFSDKTPNMRYVISWADGQPHIICARLAFLHAMTGILR